MLSPYLKFGCLSPRLFWYRLHETLGRFSGQKAQPPVSLVGQLLWREFYYCVGAFTPNFDKMEGNPICVQVDWDENEEYLKVDHKVIHFSGYNAMAPLLAVCVGLWS